MAQPLTVNNSNELVEYNLKLKRLREDKITAGKIFPVIAEKLADTTGVVEDSLSLNAWLFLNSPYKYHWYCGGIGTGKSYIAARYSLNRVMSNWETVGLIAANTHTQLAQSTLPHLFTLFDEAGLQEDRDYVVNKTPPKSWKARNLFKYGYEGIISIKTGVGKVAHILVRTLNNWTAIRGVTIGWAVLDEIADTKDAAFKEIKERLRCKLSHALQIRVVGMPAMPGNNWTYREFTPKDPEARAMYKITFQSSTEARHLDWNEYLFPLLKNMGPLEALQKIHARIVIDQTGMVYYAYQDQINNRLKYKYDPSKTIFACWDFNIMSSSPIALVLFQEHWDYERQHWDVQVFDEFILTSTDTQGCCNDFLKKYRRHYGDIWVLGDATSNLNRTVPEFVHIRDSWKPVFGSRLKMVQIDDKSNPRESYRVSAMNKMLQNSFGVPRMFICPDNCPETIQDILEVKPKDGKIDKSDKKRTHATDGLGYGICIRHPPVEMGKNSSIKGGGHMF